MAAHGREQKTRSLKIEFVGFSHFRVSEPSFNFKVRPFTDVHDTRPTFDAPIDHYQTIQKPPKLPMEEGPDPWSIIRSQKPSKYSDAGMYFSHAPFNLEKKVAHS